MTTERVDIKVRLRQALSSKGWKPVDLSYATGIPKSSISYYLKGVNEPRQDRIHLMSKALGVDPAWLMGYDVSPDRTEEQKKNDELMDVVQRLRGDDDFYEVVHLLASLPPEEYVNIRGILAALVKR